MACATGIWGRCLSSHALGLKRNRSIKGVMGHLVGRMAETISLHGKLLTSKLYLAWGLACFVPVNALGYSFLWIFFRNSSLLTELLSFLSY